MITLQRIEEAPEQGLHVTWAHGDADYETTEFYPFNLAQVNTWVGLIRLFELMGHNHYCDNSNLLGIMLGDYHEHDNDSSDKLARVSEARYVDENGVSHKIIWYSGNSTLEVYFRKTKFNSSGYGYSRTETDVFGFRLSDNLALVPPEVDFRGKYSYDRSAYVLTLPKDITLCGKWDVLFETLNDLGNPDIGKLRYYFVEDNYA